MKPLSSSVPQPAAETFPIDFERCMHQLRGSLTELLASKGEDPALPQVLSRRLGINKNLAWKVCKLINSTDAYASVQHVPGPAGLKILLEAFGRHGAPPTVVSAVQLAMVDFDRMTREHVGDRGNLELYVGSVQSEGVHSTQLETKRRNAYQGNSVIWGVQARLAISLRVIAPNAEDPDRADLAAVGGLFGFRRLRSAASWPVLQQETIGQNVDIGKGSYQAVDPEFDGDGPPLIGDFCSRPVVQTRAIVEGSKTTYEICEGPVGKTAAVDVTFGSIERSHVPVRSDDIDSLGEHYCRCDTPVEMVQFDLLLHRDLPFPLPPKLATVSIVHGAPGFPLSRCDRFRLPGRETVQELGPTHASVASPHLARFPELAAKTCERMGRPLEEFRGYRMTLSYPPIPTIFVMHHPLGPAQSEG